MPFRQTIAAKIYGLAIILLLLTIGLACFLLFEVTRTTRDLTVVANFDVPMPQSLVRLHEFGLRRRLEFERWFGALNAHQPNPEVVTEATRITRSLLANLRMNFPLPGASLKPTRRTHPVVTR